MLLRVRVAAVLRDFSARQQCAAAAVPGIRHLPQTMNWIRVGNKGNMVMTQTKNKNNTENKDGSSKRKTIQHFLKLRIRKFKAWRYVICRNSSRNAWYLIGNLIRIVFLIFSTKTFFLLFLCFSTDVFKLSLQSPISPSMHVHQNPWNISSWMFFTVKFYKLINKVKKNKEKTDWKSPKAAKKAKIPIRMTKERENFEKSVWSEARIKTTNIKKLTWSLLSICILCWSSSSFFCSWKSRQSFCCCSSCSRRSCKRERKKSFSKSK